jgi:hypothetical protein
MFPTSIDSDAMDRTMYPRPADACIHGWLQLVLLNEYVTTDKIGTLLDELSFQCDYYYYHIIDPID